MPAPLVGVLGYARRAAGLGAWPAGTVDAKNRDQRRA